MAQQITRRERYFATNGIQLHAAVWDSPNKDARPLLLLHGMWDSWKVFDRAAPLLAQRRSVYAFDLRGHGGSDKPDTGYRIADYAADIAGILQHFAVPVDLAGHSLGGVVATQTAANVPDAIAHLILIDPPYISAAEIENVRGQWQQALALKHAPYETVVGAFTTMFKRLDQAWIADNAHSLINTADGPLLALVNREQEPIDWSALLPRLPMPTLALAADTKLGAWLSGERRKMFEAALPAARIVDFPGCGHHIEAECSEAFVDAVEDFLRA